MEVQEYIRYSLALQGIDVYESDLPYIHNLLFTMNQAQVPLQAFPLNKEVPITVVDKGMLKK
ncbi:hypothetical protein [Mesobacillus maritimus]|uniref:Uncharacterized protein n=1 Tax=Mesobacillus maritimus TaxID=1643336 RepID=A0ABS7K0H2_9BACI|nr:hypothetical protein [Mesobacillus maritimus]MBY0095723.1 hypothetical protein [Mesobacillus maritimus]